MEETEYEIIIAFGNLACAEECQNESFWKKGRCFGLNGFRTQDNLNYLLFMYWNDYTEKKN